MVFIKTVILLVSFAIFSLGFSYDCKAAEKEESLGFGDLFEGKGGYIHPFFSVSTVGSDNIASTHEDPSSDSYLTITPGIWVAFPASRQQLLQLDTSSYAPGGLNVGRTYTQYLNRFQTYLLYTADNKTYSTYSQRNTMNKKLEGILQYNLKGGLSFELYGQTNQYQDQEELTESTELDTYVSTLTGAILSYFISERFNCRLDFSYFDVQYDHERNQAKNRYDSSIAAYLFFGLSPKTELFLQYQGINIKYDERLAANSIQTHYFAGIQWKITEKSRGNFRLGQTLKEFEVETLNPVTSLIMELIVSHTFTPKTSFNISASQKTREPLSTDENYVLNQTASVSYSQNFTDRISLKLYETYVQDEYIRSEESIKKNITTVSKIGLQYRISDWIIGDIAYSNSNTDSTIDTLDTITSESTLRITAFF